VIETPEIRRILQEVAAAPDEGEWFREHPKERDQLRAFLEEVAREQQRLRDPGAQRSPL